MHAFQVKGKENQEEILGRGFIEDKLCELGLGEVTAQTIMIMPYCGTIPVLGLDGWDGNL